MLEKIVHEIQLDGYTARFCGVGARLQLGTYGSYGIEQLHIELGESWQGLVVYANFVTADGTTPVLVPESGLVDVPPEATAKPGTGNIVLDGTTDGVRLYSVNIPYIMLNHSDLSGEAPAPTPDRWEQYVAQVKDDADRAGQAAGAASDSAAAAAKSAEAAAESAKQAAQATADIGEAKDDALEAIQKAQDTGVQAIQTAHQAALDDIATDRQQALTDIEGAGDKQQSAITSSGAAALEAIGRVEQAAIGQVQQAGATQVDAVNAAGQAQLDKINAANALVPTPTEADAGKAVLVKPDGSGYALGEVQTDAYTKTESDARYAPIEAAIRPTVSGNPATLEHSVAWAMQGLSVYGKSTQDGVPSPESPVSIVSAGDGGSIGLTVSDGADQSQSLTVSTPTGLSGIPVDSGGNYTDADGQRRWVDIIDYSNEKKYQYINKVVVDGTNVKFTSGSGGQFWNLPQYSAPSSADIQEAQINKYFPSRVFAANDAYDFIFAFPNRMAPYFETVEELNAFCAQKNTEGDPLTIMYVMDTPIETPLSDEELAAYAALRTYDGTTVVATDAPVAGLSARYVADGAAYIDSKIQSAVTQAVAAAVSLTGGAQ